MSIVSRRLIKDYMITHNFVPSNFRITPELIKSVSLFHNRCTAFLKDQKKESQRSCRPTSPSTRKGNQGL